MNIVGIDPGLKGGICIYDNNYWAIPMPVHDNLISIPEILLFVREHTNKNPVVFIENVHAMPRQGVVSMFSFGKGFGQLIGMCQAFDWEYRLVRPQEWKKVVLKDSAHDKDAAIAWVENNTGVNLVLPRHKRPHDGMADAICITNYGRIMI